MKDKFKKILFVGTSFPPAKGGSVVVMNMLLKQLQPPEWRVITMHACGKSDDLDFEKNVLRIGSYFQKAGRFSMWMRCIAVFFYLRTTIGFARSFKPSVLVASYPSLDFLFLGYLIAKRLRIPFIPYLHDTIVEAMGHGINAALANFIQKCVFKNTEQMFVMSEGMSDLYKEKYNKKTITLPHIYPECGAMPSNHKPANSAFWAGAVYEINHKAVARVSNAIGALNLHFVFTSRMTMESLKGYDVNGAIMINELPTRKDYLECMSEQGVLILALNDASECKIGADELATIFPTKTPEYLASGRPILVHCPEHYFLAKFFDKYQCGTVVASKDITTIANALRKVLAGGPEIETKIINARNAVNLFSAEKVERNFYEGIVLA